MKTTIELPDPIFRRAKVAAAQRGVPLRQLFTEALEAKLAEPSPGRRAAEPEWRRLWREWNPPPSLKAELTRIAKLIDEEFETIEPEDET